VNELGAAEKAPPQEIEALEMTEMLVEPMVLVSCTDRRQHRVDRLLAHDAPLLSARPGWQIATRASGRTGDAPLA
jgi:hypothetical protein